ncbi:MAG TPA: hypothetical protein VJ417_14230, partial [Candidatus Glassbacteria bacterium]|nr:hypothetical protein [Candidatus Glassbacteria bacterium]
GFGWGTADISYNRLEKLADGGVNMKWANHEKTPLGPVDQTLGVIRIDNLDGQPVAVLVNYACHPVILGMPGKNMMYSADFPGEMCQRVSESLPGNPECIFFNGACGNLNPYYAHSVDDPKPRIEEVGRELADEVLRVCRETVTKPCPDSRVQSRLDHYPTSGRWDTAKWLADDSDPGKRERASRVEAKQAKINLPLSIVLLTPDIGFVGLPGEFFFEFQQQIRRQSPVDFLFVTGYTNGDYGYFPTVEAAVAGGYGANDEATYTAAGAGEHLAIEAIVNLNEMVGKLRAVPSSGESGYQK